MRTETSGRQAANSQRRGATLVEFALSFTLFFMITVVGTLDFGRMIWAYNIVAHASHEAVRYAIVHGGKSSSPADATAIENYVKNRAFVLEPGGGVTVTTTWTPDNQPGSVVRVQVEHDFQPLLANLLQQQIHLTSTSEMVIAN